MYLNSTTALTVDYVSNAGDGFCTVHFANGQSADVHQQAVESVESVKPGESAQFTFDGHGYVIAVEET